VEEEGGQSAPPAAEDALVARISLRLPEGLKVAIEAAATREGVSVNSWLVRSLARAVGSGGGGGRRGAGNRLTGFGRS
jgi:predicted HicB family RNase H-like nuclease